MATIPIATELTGLPDIVLALAALLGLAAVLAVLTRKAGVPLTLILVLVGFAAGEVARARGVELPIEGEGFEEVLVFIFLPALVFAAALELPARVFSRNLVPILALAIWALLISAALVAVAVHVGLGASIAVALLFGALISATDPVAVTAVFRELGVPKRLLVLVEGESLLNDGVAIVLFNILLVAALGTEDVGVLDGVLDFLVVALGGVAMGALLGLLVGELTPRLGPLPSTALTIATAYGGFVLAEETFGFSGVMATVAAGLVLSALAGTLIPRRDWEMWATVWQTLAFTANGILFVLIGIVVDPELISDHAGAIALAVGAVLIARPLAIFPIMPLVTRVARLPQVGRRNEAVLVWGGLRGGVALALALSIPETLPERDQIVAMTGGVVVTTLVLNATTIGPLIRRLGLDRPDRLSQWVAAAARFDGANAARTEMHGARADSEVEWELSEVEEAAAEEVQRLALTPDETYTALLRRGLAVERATFQEQIEHGLLPQWHARVILATLDDQVEELQVGVMDERDIFELRGIREAVYRIARLLHVGRLTPEVWVDIAYRDLNARQIASRRALEALEHFQRCPGVDPEAAARGRAHFQRFHERALADIGTLTRTAPSDLIDEARRHYAMDLAALDSERELAHLADLGLVTTASVDSAGEAIRAELVRRERARRERIRIEVDPDLEDLGT